MPRPVTRRRALKSAAMLGAGALGLAQDTPIQLTGRPVEIALTPVSPLTVCITIQAIENGQAAPMIGFRETPSYNPDPRELNNPAVEPICKK